MTEEWEVAALKTTKRVLHRNCIRQGTQLLTEHTSPRIYLHGAQGTGKAVALATLVASARASNYIVMYMPDGDRLRKNGNYVEPNLAQKDLFDLPMLSQEVCHEFLKVHEADLEGFSSTIEARDALMHPDVLLDDFWPEGDFDRHDVSLVGLLKLGAASVHQAPMALKMVVDVLKNQTDRDFLVAMDGFDCYYDHGHYFHGEWSRNNYTPIPNRNISSLESPTNLKMMITNHPN